MQEAAKSAVMNWFDKASSRDKTIRNSVPPFFYLAGYAGSGKTSIAKTIVSSLFPEGEPDEDEQNFEDEDDELARSPYRYAAYTGKASLVLERKGCAPVSTIHGLIYRLDGDKNDPTIKPKFIRRDFLPYSLQLIIPDECSMINIEMANDLLHYKKPMLFLGDPGQLPPVEGEGFFSATRAPDFMLTEIHRQAQDSPILLAATAAREGKSFPTHFPNSPETSVTLLANSPSWGDLLTYDQILCGLNKTRDYLNDMLRLAQGYRTPASPNPFPQPGEKIICLRNNWNIPGMVNGSMWKVISCEMLPPDHINFKGQSVTISNRMSLKLISWDVPETEIEVKTHLSFFDKTCPAPKTPPEWSGITQFAFGYAITTHKSQGSEWDKVFLFNESASFRDQRKQWLYTAVTRAAKHLTIRL